VFERFKKTEMEKEKRRNKNRKRPRGNDLAQPQKQPTAQQCPAPEAVPSPLSFLADWWDPPVISLLPLIPLPLAGNGRELLPSSIP
jgi:hypothetical protein